MSDVPPPPPNYIDPPTKGYVGIVDSTNSAVVAQPVAAIHGVVIKPMTIEDCEFAGAMCVDAFRSKFEVAVGKENIDVAKRGCTHELATRPPGGLDNVFIAWYEGQRAGYMCLKYHDSKNLVGESEFPGIGCCGMIRMILLDTCLSESSIKKGYCYVEAVAVHESARGKGIGKALMQWADKEGRERGCHSIYLMVLASNRAQNLYQRQGYIVTDNVDGCCCTSFAVGERHFYKMEKRL